MSDTELSADGRWSVSPRNTAPYTTRVLVRRPAARAHFNGAVVVEWLNVSGGFDAAPDWTSTHTMLMRDGFAWIGVSAQYIGVHGGPPLDRHLALTEVDPVRYGPLAHPGDTYSYDIFSQAGLAARRLASVLLGDLRPKRVIAVGQSQSAARLVMYINAIHPLAHVYDGFLVHSRGAGAATLSLPQPVFDGPPLALLRADVDVPVLTFETETDVVAIGFLAARQPDGPNIRTWEVAGTAHGDTYMTTVVGRTDRGPAAADTTHLPPVYSILDGSVACDLPINAGPQHYVLSAALRRLERWVRTGRGPASTPPLSVRAGSPPTLERDPRGNAVGGIRTPQVDVPVAVVSGIGQPDRSPCGRLGTTIAFDAATLASLYPSHRSYVTAVRRAARQTVKRGALIAIDAKAIRRAAAASGVGR